MVFGELVVGDTDGDVDGVFEGWFVGDVDGVEDGADVVGVCVIGMNGVGADVVEIVGVEVVGDDDGRLEGAVDGIFVGGIEG